MNKKVHYQRVAEPTLFITKDKQRIKQHDGIVYLNDGDEFELELFNPTQEKILAKIKLNNYEMSSGIILRPGERVFLERYLDEAKKFIFETYNVDGDDPNAQEAIKENGTVNVSFHQQQTNAKIWINDYYESIKYIPQPMNPGPCDYPNTFPYYTQPVYYSNTSGDSLTVNAPDNITFSNNNYGFASANYAYHSNQINEVETGRVEKGSHSDQSFNYDNTEFSAWASWTSSWKILPISRKAYKREELVVYCTNCGARRKKSSYKYCPNCGSRFS
jgi:hypothetical protein